MPPGRAPTPDSSGGSEPAGDREAIEAVLRERARRLATAAAGSGGGATVEVLECRLGDSQYALEMRLLGGVQRATGLTPVPCAPGFVAGLLNVRGEVVTVLDLAVALGLTPLTAPAAGGRAVLLVDMPGVRVGLLVDGVLGVRPLALAALQRAPSGGDAARGVADTRTVLLDLERLFGDGHFEVAEEVVTS